MNNSGSRRILLRGGNEKKDSCCTLYVKDFTEVLGREVEFCGRMTLCCVRSREILCQELLTKVRLWRTLKRVTKG